MTKANISEYEELEQRLIEKDAQFREYFTTTGVIGDRKIKDPKKRESQQKKRRRLYQNTQVLIQILASVRYEFRRGDPGR